jgi:hypothetical protein
LADADLEAAQSKVGALIARSSHFANQIATRKLELTSLYRKGYETGAVLRDRLPVNLPLARLAPLLHTAYQIYKGRVQADPCTASLPDDAGDLRHRIRALVDAHLLPEFEVN